MRSFSKEKAFVGVHTSKIPLDLLLSAGYNNDRIVLFFNRISPCHYGEKGYNLIKHRRER